jgi:hypothetical protein
MCGMSFDPLIPEAARRRACPPLRSAKREAGEGDHLSERSERVVVEGVTGCVLNGSRTIVSARLRNALTPEVGFYFCTPPPPRFARSPSPAAFASLHFAGEDSASCLHAESEAGWRVKRVKSSRFSGQKSVGVQRRATGADRVRKIAAAPLRMLSGGATRFCAPYG